MTLTEDLATVFSLVHAASCGAEAQDMMPARRRGSRTQIVTLSSPMRSNGATGILSRFGNPCPLAP
jgi:hypothetical protein